MKNALLCLFLLSSGMIRAQNWIDLFNVYYRISPGNDIPYGPDAQRDFSLFTADCKIPVVLNQMNVLIFGYEFHHTWIKTSEPGFTNYSFASHNLQVGLEHKWSGKSKMMFMIMGRLNSDYRQIDLNHFQIGGLALGTINRSENFEWKYGLYFNSEFFGPMLVPLFGFNWKINERLRFKMLFPINLEFAWQPKAWFRGGLRFDGVNASYKAQMVPGQSWSNIYIDRADNNGWLFSEFKLFNNFWLHFKAGASVLRKYRAFYPGDKMSLKLGPVNIEDNRNAGDPKSVPIWFRNGWSFECRILYRLPI